MKSGLIHVLFLFFEICVFGDAGIVETVSVIEGDSVTLHTNVTEIQKADVIEWRFNGNLIARISGDSIKTNGAYKDRMKLYNQTGDLKITNIKTTDSGEYKLKIRTTTRGSPEKTFSVSVDSRFDGVTDVSVTEGDSVVLHADTKILKDVEILWRFSEKYDIAKMKKDEHIFSTYYDVPDGRFKDRLQLDNQTGSLTITNTRTNHSGLYHLDITSVRHTIFRKIVLSVCGSFPCPDDVKWMVPTAVTAVGVGVLVAAAAYVIYRRFKRAPKAIEITSSSGDELLKTFQMITAAFHCGKL